MSKIIFNSNPSVVYDGQFSQIGTNQVRLIMKDSLPEESVLLSGFVLVNEHNKTIQTDRKDYIYLYRTYDDSKTIELCNNDIQWIKTTPIVKFIINGFGALDGKLEQTVENYEDLSIPLPIENETCKFLNWYPEIPSSGVIEKDMTFIARFASILTEKENRILEVKNEIDSLKAELATTDYIIIKSAEINAITDDTLKVAQLSLYEENYPNLQDIINDRISLRESINTLEEELNSLQNISEE